MFRIWNNCHMDLSTPGADVLGPTRARVLSALARMADPVSGREVARLAGGLAPSSTHRELTDLVTMGVVLARPSSHATTYTLNREHALWPALAEIVGSAARVEQRIRNLVTAALGPETSCGVFGSVARGDSGPTSDIDLVMVSPDDATSVVEALDRISADLTLFTGNLIQIVSVTRSQLRAMALATDPLVDSLRSDLRMICGPDIGDLLRKA
jgi:predicted nucleotidyltransferase